MNLRNMCKYKTMISTLTNNMTSQSIYTIIKNLEALIQVCKKKKKKTKKALIQVFKKNK